MIDVMRAKPVADLLWAGVRTRAADVLDSRHGSVRWVPDDAEHAFDIVHDALPPARVTFRLDAVTATIDGADLDLAVGRRGMRRTTWGVSARYGEHDYRLVQRGRRLAELERDGGTIALLARPRGGSRSVNWAMAAVSDAEIALGHALAVAGEIGSPGAVANVFSVLPI